MAFYTNRYSTDVESSGHFGPLNIFILVVMPVGRCRFVEAPAGLAMTGVTWSFMGCRTPLVGATLRCTTTPDELLGAGPL